MENNFYAIAQYVHPHKNLVMTESNAAQKLRGGFYTPTDIAAFLAKWVAEINPGTILEPSCGDGVFLDALAKLVGPKQSRIVACEIDCAEAKKARERLSSSLRQKTQIHTGDFLQWFLAACRT